MRENQIIDTVLIRNQQSFEDFDVLNPIEIKIKDNQILNKLKKGKQFISSFYTCWNTFQKQHKIKNKLDNYCLQWIRNAHNSLINGKSYKILVFINIDSIYN